LEVINYREVKNLIPGFLNWGARPFGERESFAREARVWQRHAVVKQDNGK